MQERWKLIPGYEGYQVSDLGRVRSLNYNRTGKVRLLNPLFVSSGYYQVILFKDKKKKQLYIHRLVVTAFRGPIPPGMVVNHINEIKTDNRLSNLEICTVAQNNNYGTRNERLSKELQLTNTKTFAKYTFSSSCEASAFFSYKRKNTVGTLICKARQRGQNFINLRGIRYFFSQAS